MTQPTTSEARAALLEYADRYGYTDHVNALLDAYRAAVLDEAADAIEQAAGDMTRFRGSQIAAELRRMAEEARS
ncbi:hypothetical protein [Streptomyces zaomyceticus]|uniref:hypothetical protein n=1 Tax=Streptomyces zaomyceticus TaxID=68286 RepID=UPI0037B389AC